MIKIEAMVEKKKLNRQTDLNIIVNQDYAKN